MFPLSGWRGREANEIIPLRAEQSETYTDSDDWYEGKFEASSAIDLNLRTNSWAMPGPSSGGSWLKIILKKVECVHQVIRYGQFIAQHFATWTCSGEDCSQCGGSTFVCSMSTVTVSTSGGGVTPTSPASNCRYGDTVILAINPDEADQLLSVWDMAVIGLPDGKL